MIYVLTALIVTMLLAPFLIRNLRRNPIFVPLHTFEGKQRVVHNLGTVQENNRKFECYVIEEQ